MQHSMDYDMMECTAGQTAVHYLRNCKIHYPSIPAATNYSYLEHSEVELCASPTSWKELIDWPHNTLAHCESRFNDTHNLSTVLHCIKHAPTELH